MRLRTVATLILPLTFAGCGGSSTPTDPTSPPAAVLNLAAGSYALTLTMSETGEPVCNGSLCTSFSLCGGAGAPPAVRTLTTVVRLDRSGDAVTVRPDDPSATFRLALNVAGDTVAGTAAGEIRNGAIQISVESANGQAAAVAVGRLLPAAVTGTIDGQVSIGDYGCSNNGHAWTLAPR